MVSNGLEGGSRRTYRGLVHSFGADGALVLPIEGAGANVPGELAHRLSDLACYSLVHEGLNGGLGGRGLTHEHVAVSSRLSGSSDGDIALLLDLARQGIMARCHDRRNAVRIDDAVNQDMVPGGYGCVAFDPGPNSLGPVRVCDKT